MDISDVEEALDFMRGFVGGRAYMSEVPNEQVWKVSCSKLQFSSMGMTRELNKLFLPIVR